MWIANFRRGIAFLAVAVTMIIIASITAFADELPYVRLETVYEPYVYEVHPEELKLKSNQKVYETDIISLAPEKYKMGDAVQLIVDLVMTDSNYSFNNIKTGSCQLDGETAKTMEILDGGNRLRLAFDLPALNVILPSPGYVKLDSTGKATWDKVKDADSYLVVLQKMSDLGQRNYVGNYEVTDNQIDLHDKIYNKAGDYLITVRAQSNRYWLQNSASTELPLQESILLTAEDVGLPSDQMSQDGKVYQEGVPMTNQNVRVCGYDYYLGDDGLPVTGWILDETGWRFYERSKGRRVSGKNIIDGEEYYFDPKTGYMRTGLVTVDEGKEKFYAKSGEAKTGWVKLDGKIYYILPDGSRNMQQLIDQNGKTYMFGADGSLLERK